MCLDVLRAARREPAAVEALLSELGADQRTLDLGGPASFAELHQAVLALAARQRLPPDRGDVVDGDEIPLASLVAALHRA